MELGCLNEGKYSVWVEKKIIPPQTPRPDFSRRHWDCARKRYLHKPKYVLILKERINQIMPP